MFHYYKSFFFLQEFFFPLKDIYETMFNMGFPCGSASKESTCNAGDPGLNPGSGTSSGEGKGYPLSIWAWRIPWSVMSIGSQRVGHH